MLIGYESGQIVFWDLKTKNADYRCQSDVPLRSISWHHEGKQFMCSHTDGSLSTWTVRQLKPTNITYPHGKKFSPFIFLFLHYKIYIFILGKYLHRKLPPPRYFDSKGVSTV